MKGIYFRRNRPSKPWLVRVLINGETVSQCFASEQEAVAFRNEWKAKRENERPPSSVSPKPGRSSAPLMQGLKFRDAVQQWLVDHSSGLTGNSQAAYAEITFGRLMKWFGDFEIRSIDDRVVEGFARHCLTAPSERGSPLTTKTVRNLLTPLNQFFLWAMKERLVSTNPVPVGIAFLKVDKRKSEHDQERKRLAKQRFWTLEEAKRVLDLAQEEPELWMPIFFGLHTAAREGELGALRWGDISSVDPVLGTLLAEPYVEFKATVVRYRKVGPDEFLQVYGPERDKKVRHRPLIQGHTKGKDDRKVPLNGLVFEALMKWKTQAQEVYGYGTEDDDLVFPCVGPKRFLTFKNHTFREIVERVGLPVHKRGTHCQRRSCGTFMLRLGVPLPTIQKVLGHKDVLTTMRYLCDDGLAAGATSPLETLFADCAPRPKDTPPTPITLPGSNVTHVAFGALSASRRQGNRG